MKRRWILSWQAAIAVAFVLAWEYVPKVPGITDHVKWFDPFFISSPSLVFERTVDLFAGADGLSVWPYLWNTLKATFIGTAIGLLLGAAAGALLSNNETLARIFAPFITMVNAIPRVALIPIVVLIVGPTLAATAISSVLVVLFLAFFNALEGGRSVPEPVLQNARLLGATHRQLMVRVRSSYVLIWTFAAIPNIIAFGLLTVVTAELLTGSVGMGSLILSATTNVDASLSLSVVAVLSVVGAALVGLAEIARARILHWR